MPGRRRVLRRRRGCFDAPAGGFESRPQVLAALRACGDPKAGLTALRSVARGWATQYWVVSSWRFLTSVPCCNAHELIVTAFHSDASIAADFVVHSLCTAHC